MPCGSSGCLCSSVLSLVMDELPLHLRKSKYRMPGFTSDSEKLLFPWTSRLPWMDHCIHYIYLQSRDLNRVFVTASNLRCSAFVVLLPI
jgi:hypothetical protein